MSMAARAYGRTQGETASRERLMVLLFEATLRHIRVAAAHLEKGRPRDAAAPLARASEIVSELVATLDHARAPELCAQLQKIYLFVSARLLAASMDRSAGPAREAERALAPVAEGFAEAVRLQERGAAAPAR
jgi:flagellar protein FliS